MEEIKGTEALEREILEDAAKRAEKIVRKAKEEAEAYARTSAEELQRRLEAMEREKTEKIAQMERETLSKVPLEKTRRKARFIDEALRGAVGAFIDSLAPETLGRWCLAELGKRSKILAGRSLRVRCEGIDADSVRAIGVLLGSEPVTGGEGAPRRGVVAESLDGAMKLAVTVEQLEERLLDERRGELAAALLPSMSPEGVRE